jgi:hypothetical protein
MRKLLAICILIIGFGSCGNPNEILLPSATGAEGELMLVIDDKYWRNSPIGDTLRDWFQREMPGLPQVEPMFKLSRIGGDKFRGSIRWHRNIFLVVIDRGAVGQAPSLEFGENAYAKGQRVCRLAAAHPNEWLAAFRSKRSDIEKHFRDFDILSLEKRMWANPSRAAVDSLKLRMGIDMVFAAGFGQALARKELTQFSYNATRREDGMELTIQKGILLARVPYRSEKVFTMNGMIQLCDSLTGMVYEGTNEGSKMVVEHRVDADTSYISYHGRYGMELRGLWRMSVESRGGPFLAYAIHDSVRNDLLVLHGFVFAAGMDKRNHMLQMEAMLRSARW